MIVTKALPLQQKFLLTEFLLLFFYGGQSAVKN